MFTLNMGLNSHLGGERGPGACPGAVSGNLGLEPDLDLTLGGLH